MFQPGDEWEGRNRIISGKVYIFDVREVGNMVLVGYRVIQTPRLVYWNTLEMFKQMFRFTQKGMR